MISLPTGSIFVAVEMCFIVSIFLLRDVSALTSVAGNTVDTFVYGQCQNHGLFAESISEDLPIEPLSAISNKKEHFSIASDAFLNEYFQSEIDNVNLPPSMSIIHRSIGRLLSGSDVRGHFVKQPQTGRMSSLARSISQTSLPALTPFAAHCLGFAFGTMMKELQQVHGKKDKDVIICIGRDPREHGVVLADSFARGAGGLKGVKVLYT